MSSHDTSISPLRQRMIEDMTLRKLSPKTQSGYLRWVKRLNGFLKRSPATATAEDLRRFQLDLVERGVRRGSVNAAWRWSTANGNPTAIGMTHPCREAGGTRPGYRSYGCRSQSRRSSASPA